MAKFKGKMGKDFPRLGTEAQHAERKMKEAPLTEFEKRKKALPKKVTVGDALKAELAQRAKMPDGAKEVQQAISRAGKGLPVWMVANLDNANEALRDSFSTKDVLGVYQMVENVMRSVDRVGENREIIQKLRTALNKIENYAYTGEILEQDRFDTSSKSAAHLGAKSVIAQAGKRMNQDYYDRLRESRQRRRGHSPANPKPYAAKSMGGLSLKNVFEKETNAWLTATKKRKKRRRKKQTKAFDNSLSGLLNRAIYGR